MADPFREHEKRAADFAARSNNDPTDKPALDPRLQNWNSVRLILLASLNTRRTKAELQFGKVKFDYWEHEGCILLSPPNRLAGCDFVLRTDGTLYPTKTARKHPREVRLPMWNALLQLRDEPFHFITRQGRETGVCCMCGRELTDPQSIARGIGPVCGGKIDRILKPKRNQQDEATLDLFK